MTATCAAFRLHYNYTLWLYVVQKRLTSFRVTFLSSSNASLRMHAAHAEVSAWKSKGVSTLDARALALAL
jgi:hypothetical protein